MIKKFWKELLLAAVLATALFTAMDFAGNIFAPETGNVEISAGLMLFSIMALFLPALVGCIPSGYLIAKKTKDIKAIIFVPALGAAIGSLALMALSAVSLLLMTDAMWQAQMDELAGYGVEFFAAMPLADYKSMVIFSVIFGAAFLAVINFAIGLAGGFLGSKIAKKK
jgi:hypothetical protein